MATFHQADHDHLGRSYVGSSRNYRWWVTVRHDFPYRVQMQVYRVTNDHGVPCIGKCLYSNLPKAEQVNELDTRLHNKIARLSIEHHLRHGKKSAFQEYKREPSGLRLKSNGTGFGQSGADYKKSPDYAAYRKHSRSR